MPSSEHRKTNMMELFFDLVFVYAVSNSATLLHHVSGGILPAVTLFQYVITFLVFLSIWMTETLYLNRYGTHGIRDNVFLLIEMFLLLYLASAAADDWNVIFVQYSILLILLQLCNVAQYIFMYFESRDAKEKSYIRVHIGSLSIFALFLGIGIQFDSIVGSCINVAGLLLALSFPAMKRQNMLGQTVHFPYLVERFGLFVILTFGEVVISILPYFQLGRIQMYPLMVFLIVAMMFLYYVVFFDQLVEHERKTSGLRLIYTHIPLVLSLGTVTAVFHFMHAESANPLFITCMLYGCLLLYLLSIFGNLPYVKSGYPFGAKHFFVALGIYIVFGGTSILLHHNLFIVAALAAAMLLLLFLQLSMIKRKGDRQHCAIHS